jgi:hypothetical protein
MTQIETETLDERSILRQLQALRARCAERFPTRGLTQTIGHLLDMARPTARQARSLRKTHWLLRILSFLAIAAAAFGLFKLIESYDITLGGHSDAIEFTQAVDAAFNIILLSGAFIVFFFTLENRFKRTRALNGLYKLRAIAHVIDMHQLTKDPGWVAGQQRTASSPVRDLTDDQLLRYLDYCSEALSLTGKLGALYAQYFPDATVISAVNDIEELATNLSRKIWQKIMLLQSVKTGGPSL